MTRRSALVLLLMLFVPAPRAQDAVPPGLVAMAETEREFARTARAKGIRDSFLEFFSDDALAFAPEPVSAKKRLEARPSQPFSAQELTWEPRLGDIAASGELGWLTGPSTFINHAGEDRKPRYGNYLSVWRRQPDGRWRVFIDVGADLPSPAPFAPGFTRFDPGSRYTGPDGKEAATASLALTDGDLNEAIAVRGAVAAFAARLAPAARLHRNGVLPLTGADAIRTWLEGHARGMRAQSGAAEAAASGDFGYTYGSFEVPSGKPQKVAYVRLWSRDAIGRWLLVVDAVG